MKRVHAHNSKNGVVILVRKTDSILRFMFGIQERVCAMIFLIKSSNWICFFLILN